MKKLLLSLMAAGAASLLATASAQPAPGDENNNGNPPADQPGPPPEMSGGGGEAGGPPGAPPENAAGGETTAADQAKGSLVITPSQGQSSRTEQYSSAYMPPIQAGTNVNDLTLNFNRAPLEMVLNYLSDAAGFIIVQETHISSSVTVTVKGKHLTQDEAINLLNAVLNQNGLAAIRDGRTLTVVDKNDAKTREIPVKSGNKPEDIPKNAEIVTQIIPIRFVEARQLVSDLSSFVSAQATVVANEAGNSIVITDTQANIHHLAEIIKAIDDSAEAETEIRVFRLTHANPNDVATELSSIFPSSTSGNTTQSPIRFGGGGPGGPGGFFQRMMAGAGASSSSSSSSDRIKKATQVSAVADSRIQAVIVTAPKDLMEEIAGMMKDLDVASDRDQDVYVFQMKNGDPQQVVTELQNLFPTSTSSRSSSSSSTSSALTTRSTSAATTMGTVSTTSSSGSIGSSTGRSGGGGSF
jgi:type II secretory pathway component GspD/PulD (secretin)